MEEAQVFVSYIVLSKFNLLIKLNTVVYDGQTFDQSFHIFSLSKTDQYSKQRR